MNTPNKLTVLRMIITPVFLAVILSDISYNFFIAFIIFALGSLTDALDGHLARKNNQITVFGKLVDPVADKMLTTAALLAFMHYDLCNAWIVMIVLAREFAVTSIRLVASAQGVVIPANIWGKLKTVSQMVFTLIIMLLAQFDFKLKNTPFTVSQTSVFLLWITAVLTVVSGAIYIVQAKSVISFSE